MKLSPVTRSATPLYLIRGNGKWQPVLTVSAVQSAGTPREYIVVETASGDRLTAKAAKLRPRASRLPMDSRKGAGRGMGY